MWRRAVGSLLSDDTRQRGGRTLRGQNVKSLRCMKVRPPRSLDTLSAIHPVTLHHISKELRPYFCLLVFKVAACVRTQSAVWSMSSVSFFPCHITLQVKWCDCVVRDARFVRALKPTPAVLSPSSHQLCKCCCGTLYPWQISWLKEV